MVAAEDLHTWLEGAGLGLLEGRRVPQVCSVTWCLCPTQQGEILLFSRSL